MAYQSKTYSLSDEVIAWLGTLKDGYGSVNKGLLALMATQDSNGRHDTPAMQEQTREILEQIPIVDNRPKNAFCKHCGARFAGQRFATICPGCKSSGHTLTPAECPVCNEGTAI